VRIEDSLQPAAGIFNRVLTDPWWTGKSLSLQVGAELRMVMKTVKICKAV